MEYFKFTTSQKAGLLLMLVAALGFFVVISNSRGTTNWTLWGILAYATCRFGEVSLRGFYAADFTLFFLGLSYFLEVFHAPAFLCKVVSKGDNA